MKLQDKFFLFTEKIHYRSRAGKHKEGTGKTICHRWVVFNERRVRWQLHVRKLPRVGHNEKRLHMYTTAFIYVHRYATMPRAR